MGTFKAVYLTREADRFAARVAPLDDAALPEGDVTLEVEWSTVNYKDALAIADRAPVVRKWPMVAGIDGAGTVSASAHPEWKPGDRVILNWRAVCGECRACQRGQAQYCFNTHNATQKMTLEDGTELSPALGIGAFAEKTLVAAGQCTKVDPAARPAAAGLLGCGVMAGLGAALNTGNVQRGDSVAVIGCGGVGYSADRRAGCRIDHRLGFAPGL